MKPDLRDLFCLVGLGGIGYGLWGYDPRLAFVVVGLILFILGTLGLWKRE